MNILIQERGDASYRIGDHREQMIRLMENGAQPKPRAITNNSQNFVVLRHIAPNIPKPMLRKGA